VRDREGAESARASGPLFRSDLILCAFLCCDLGSPWAQEEVTVGTLSQSPSWVEGGEIEVQPFLTLSHSDFQA
jgi:hypothetical protein